MMHAPKHVLYPDGARLQKEEKQVVRNPAAPQPCSIERRERKAEQQQDQRDNYLSIGLIELEFAPLPELDFHDGLTTRP